MTKGCKKVDSSKIGRFRYEMIGETQPEMELYKIVAFICPSVTKIYFFNTALLDFVCNSNCFFLKTQILYICFVKLSLTNN